MNAKNMKEPAAPWRVVDVPYTARLMTVIDGRQRGRSCERRTETHVSSSCRASGAPVVESARSREARANDAPRTRPAFSGGENHSRRRVRAFRPAVRGTVHANYDREHQPIYAGAAGNRAGRRGGKRAADPQHRDHRAVGHGHGFHRARDPRAGEIVGDQQGVGDRHCGPRGERSARGGHDRGAVPLLAAVLLLAAHRRVHHGNGVVVPADRRLHHGGCKARSSRSRLCCAATRAAPT